MEFNRFTMLVGLLASEENFAAVKFLEENTTAYRPLRPYQGEKLIAALVMLCQGVTNGEYCKISQNHLGIARSLQNLSPYLSDIHSIFCCMIRNEQNEEAERYLQEQNEKKEEE